MRSTVSSSFSSKRDVRPCGTRTVPLSALFLTLKNVILSGRFRKSIVPEKRFSERYMYLMDFGSRVKSNEP